MALLFVYQFAYYVPGTLLGVGDKAGRRGGDSPGGVSDGTHKHMGEVSE